MPRKWRNRLPVCSANEHGSTETIRVLMGRDTLSLTSQITFGSVGLTILAEEEIEGNSDCRSRTIKNDVDPLSNDECNQDDATAKPNESAHNTDEPTAPSKINWEEMVE